jgi:hypothetical protein
VAGSCESFTDKWRTGESSADTETVASDNVDQTLTSTGELMRLKQVEADRKTVRSLAL